MPKYRSSGRIKEFAFVEFEDKSSVEKCINTFREFDNVIGDAQGAENLASVVAYVKEQDCLEKSGNSDEDNVHKVDDEKEDENKVESNATCEQHHENDAKQTKVISEIGDDGPPSKRIKADDSERGENVEEDAEQELGNDEQDKEVNDEKTTIRDDTKDHKKKR